MGRCIRPWIRSRRKGADRARCIGKEKDSLAAEVMRLTFGSAGSQAEAKRPAETIPGREDGRRAEIDADRIGAPRNLDGSVNGAPVIRLPTVPGGPEGYRLGGSVQGPQGTQVKAFISPKPCGADGAAQ